MYDFNQNLNFLKIIYTRVSTIKKHIDEYGVSVNRKYIYMIKKSRVYFFCESKK